jgi:hypothetical protein
LQNIKRLQFDERDIQEAMKLLGVPREEAMIRLRGTKPVDPESLPEDQIIFPKEVRGVNRGVGFHDDMSSIIDIAAEAVYGYRDGFCESTCKLRDLIIQESGKDIFSSPERPKCYECYQTFFIHMLSALAEGRPYSQIPDLINFLNDSRKNLETELQIVPAPERTTFKEELEDVVMFQAEDPFFFGAMRGGPPVAYKWIFRNFLYGLVANSLAEFLLGKDKKNRPNRLRLKKCPICGTFFAGRIDKIYCKRQCKSRGIYHSPEARNKIRRGQKEYYDEFFKSPPKTKPEFTEEEIEEMMRETGESREEAIAILKAETEDNDI